ncbi:MAG: hypothetical protein P4L33_00200 [Capsulimonadaceae bacterium]|nr:hypothetical protein [Capsulimonadaceae bacterium]
MNKKLLVTLALLILPGVAVSIGALVYLAHAFTKGVLLRHRAVPSLARYQPYPGSAGVVVCEPVTGHATSDAAAFGDACAEWLHYTIGGDPDAGQTPWWLGVNTALIESGKPNLRWTLDQTRFLAQCPGVPYAAVGKIDGAAANLTLTYQVYKIPERLAMGAPIVLHGTREQVVRLLPGAANSIARDIGLRAVSPIPPVLPPDDLAFVNSMRWRWNWPSGAEARRLQGLAKTDPMAALVWLNAGAYADEATFREAISTLAKLAPKSAFTWSQICYVDVNQAERFYAEVLRQAAKHPHNYLLADASVRVARAQRDEAAETAAAASVVRCAPKNPRAWLTLSWTASHAADRIRYGRTYDKISSSEETELDPLYGTSFAATARATRLDPLCQRAWAELAESATFAGSSADADHAFWKSVKLPGHGIEDYRWAFQMYQPKWGGNSFAMRKVVDAVVADKAIGVADMSELLESLDAAATSDTHDYLARTMIDKANVVLDHDPGNVKSSLIKATAQFALKIPDEAVKTIDAMNAVHPSDTSGRNLLADRYEADRRWLDARRIRVTIAAKSPDDAYNLGCLGMDYKELGMIRDAVVSLNRSVKLNPNNSTPHLYLGRLAYARHDLRGAETEFKAALACKTHLEDSLDGLAQVTDELGQYRDCIKYVLMDLQIDPCDLDALWPASDAYLQLHDYKNCDRTCNIILQIRSNDALAHENLAESYLGQKRLADAKREWKTVLTLGDARIAAAARGYLAKYP